MKIGPDCTFIRDTGVDFEVGESFQDVGFEKYALYDRNSYQSTSEKT